MLQTKIWISVADQGFPIGGRQPRIDWGANSQGNYISKILFVKTKESGPLGGSVRWGCPLDPPMNLIIMHLSIIN